MGQHFEKVHIKAQNINSDWKAHKLPFNGRINISKCLILSQFKYVALIIKPSNRQILKSNKIINAFIRDSDHHRISDQKQYAPTDMGGLNCIKLKAFFMALQVHRFKRYNNYRYEEFWILSLDKIFNVTPTNRISILKYGSKCISPQIAKCKHEIQKI